MSPGVINPFQTVQVKHHKAGLFTDRGLVQDQLVAPASVEQAGTEIGVRFLIQFRNRQDTHCDDVDQEDHQGTGNIIGGSAEIKIQDVGNRCHNTQNITQAGHKELPARFKPHRLQNHNPAHSQRRQKDDPMA